MEDINWFKLVSDNFFDFIIGTVFLGSIFGIIVEIVRRLTNYIFTRRYRGWKLVVQPQDQSRREYTHDLLWEEVMRFEKSPFENRKFIQSVCTSESERIKAGQIETYKPDSWVYLDKKDKRYRFNFSKMPDDVRAEKKSNTSL